MIIVLIKSNGIPSDNVAILLLFQAVSNVIENDMEEAILDEGSEISETWRCILC